ncbi:hypothetical protein FSP39_003953 [Pinctada imbricata]|uniref:Uncharacterized protein n=1 Tax=Pinctada imbricata TaxID=66713 RepID=A0AA88XKW1_PINIB|nr:hypothetical protein FSP39_003953 [Pinctada imbricata]
MEYGATIWNLYLKGDIEKLEKIQNRAIRFIKKDYKSRNPGPITSMRKDLETDPLEERRTSLRLILMYKVVEGLVPSLPPNSFLKYAKTKSQIKPKQYQDHQTTNLVNRHVSKWKMSRSDKFVENLNMKEENIKDLCNEVDNCSSEEHDIDGILSKLENIFSEAAIKPFGKSGRNNEQKEKSDRNNEIWFTKLCDEKRKKFHNAKKKYNKDKSSANRESLRFARKSYKKELSRSFANHQLNLEKELRQTSRNNTKEFWNILNKFSKKTKKRYTYTNRYTL